MRPEQTHSSFDSAWLAGYVVRTRTPPGTADNDVVHRLAGRATPDGPPFRQRAVSRVQLTYIFGHAVPWARSGRADHRGRHADDW